MRKHNKAVSKGKAPAGSATDAIGLDIGDRRSRYCVLNAKGEVIHESGLASTREGIAEEFEKRPRCRIALEVGTHSPWISRQLEAMGFEVYVANPRQVRLISESSEKSDRIDARMLARLVRVDPQLLRPVRHRGEHAQQDLAVIRVRAALVRARTMLVNSVRGLAKSSGARLPGCDAATLRVEHLQTLPAGLSNALKPLLEQVESLSEQILEQDRKIRQIAREEYPETALLEQVTGVGWLTALTFVLTIGERDRFAKSRDVGCYLGMRPKRNQSGESDPELGITKEGDPYPNAAGAGRASRIRMAGAGQRSEAMGSKAGGTRRKEREEAGHRGGGAKAGGAVASAVGDGRSLRTAAQQRHRDRGVAQREQGLGDTRERANQTTGRSTRRKSKRAEIEEKEIESTNL